MKEFWNGFEKRALFPTKASELGVGGVLGSLVPGGTTGHTLIGERPEGHSRVMEWLKRIGGNVGGSIVGGVAGAGAGGTIGAILGSITGNKAGAIGVGTGLGIALGSIIGHVGGEVIGQNASIGQYYDEEGKIKPEYKKHEGF